MCERPRCRPYGLLDHDAPFRFCACRKVAVVEYGRCGKAGAGVVDEAEGSARLDGVDSTSVHGSVRSEECGQINTVSLLFRADCRSTILLYPEAVLGHSFRPKWCMPRRPGCRGHTCQHAPSTFTASPPRFPCSSCQSFTHPPAAHFCRSNDELDLVVFAEAPQHVPDPNEDYLRHTTLQLADSAADVLTKLVPAAHSAPQTGDGYTYDVSMNTTELQLRCDGGMEPDMGVHE